MGQRTCRQYQMRLTDAFYGERALSPELTRHRDTCEACRKHWADMVLMNASLTQELESRQSQYAPDEVLIRQAFAKADGIIEERNKQKQFLWFVVVAVMVVALMGLPVVLNRVDWLIYQQLAVTFGGIVSVPFVIRHRLKKGW